MSTNGEFNLLRNLETCGIRTVFDVGANRGDYVGACLRHFPDAQIHAFEIVPATFRKLEDNFGRTDGVRLNAFGLSNARQSLDIQYNPDHDGTSSLIAESTRIHAADWKTVPARVETGDDYCRANAIERIDFLKIDVEGAEHLVLEGFADMLAGGRILSIQFEYGLANIYSKFLLNDFWRTLTAHGFRVGPIMPRGVAFKPYDPMDEDFQGAPNYFAAHASRSDIIDRVRLRP
ncbi:FkbM family methyltransferase [Methylobacterium sp. A54F]